MYIGFILGPAGSGKSFMTGALSHWMASVDLDVATLNLDPAVRRLPYSPDIDIREFINIDALIDDTELGPNGALVAAMDHIVAVVSELQDEIQMVGPEYLLVDTPGQMEIFAYRSSGQLITSVLSSERQPASLFMIDPLLATTPANFVSILLLGVSINYRLQTPQQNIISKADILNEATRAKIEGWVDDPYSLEEELLSAQYSKLQGDLGAQLLRVLRERGIIGEIPFVSADTNENMEISLGMLQRMWGVDDEVNP